MPKFDAKDMLAGLNQKMAQADKPEEKLPERKPTAAARVMINQVPVANIHEAADNMFSQLKDESYDSLVKSIRTDGIHDALKVERNAKEDGQFILISGHRRLSAAKEIGLATVPCVILESMSEEARVTQLLRENLGKRTPDPFGFAMQTKKIMDVRGKIENLRTFLEDEIGVAHGGPTQRLVVAVNFGYDFLTAGQNELFSFTAVQNIFNRCKKDNLDIKTIENKIVEISNSSASAEEKKAAIAEIMNPQEPTKEKESAPKHPGGRPVKTADTVEMVQKISKSFEKIQKVYVAHKDEQDSNKLAKELTALRDAIDDLISKL